MTIEKAIEYWKARYENTKYFDDVHCDASELKEHKEYVEALKETITALEKQVPKKMHLGTAWGVCPTCDRIVETIQFFKPSYCPHCGQAVIWEE